jgi:AICAR transformylase/IMP cyclohydrolase PurH
MADKYKTDAVAVAKTLQELGYGIVATRGTAVSLIQAGRVAQELFNK